MEAKEYESNVDAMNKEINAWRDYFLENVFSGEFKHVPDYYKRTLSAYFMSIPSESFTEPLCEWHKCISALLQSIED